MYFLFWDFLWNMIKKIKIKQISNIFLNVLRIKAKGVRDELLKNRPWAIKWCLKSQFAPHNWPVRLTRAEILRKILPRENLSLSEIEFLTPRSPCHAQREFVFETFLTPTRLEIFNHHFFHFCSLTFFVCLDRTTSVDF